MQMRHLQARPCTGTTKTGKSCSNKIKFDPSSDDAMLRWNSGRCGKCSGNTRDNPSAPSLRTASILREGGMSAIPDHTSREEVAEALLLEIHDAAWRKAIERDPGVLRLKQAPALMLDDADLGRVLEFAPADDPSDLATKTHLRVLQDYDIDIAGRDWDERMPTNLKRLIAGSSSPEVLVAAAQQSFYSQYSLPTAHQATTYGYSRAAEERLRERMRRANYGETQGECQRSVAKRLAALSINENLGFLQDEADEALQGMARECCDDPSIIQIALPHCGHPQRVVAEVIQGHHNQGIGMSAAVGRTLLASEHCPTDILAAEAWDPDHAAIVSAHPSCTDGIQAICADTLENPNGKKTKHSRSMRCQRRRTDGTECNNRFKNGRDLDWCGRCAGLPVGASGPGMENYLRLGEDRPTCEARRLAHHRAGISGDQDEQIAELDAMRAEASDEGFMPMDVLDPEALLDACERLMPFMSRDDSRPILQTVAFPSLEGRRVAAATDSYRLVLDYESSRHVTGLDGLDRDATPMLTEEVLLGARNEDLGIKGIHIHPNKCLRYELQDARSGARRVMQEPPTHQWPQIAGIVDQPIFDAKNGRLQEAPNTAILSVSVSDLRQMLTDVTKGERDERHQGRWSDATFIEIEVPTDGSPPSVVGLYPTTDGHERLDLSAEAVTAQSVNLPSDDSSGGGTRPDAYRASFNPKHLRDVVRSASAAESSHIQVGVNLAVPSTKPGWFMPGDGLAVLQMPIRRS